MRIFGPVARAVPAVSVAVEAPSRLVNAERAAAERVGVNSTTAAVTGQHTSFFGYLFKNMPSFTASDADFELLAQALVDSGPNDAVSDNSGLPLGYVTFAEFAAHDLTVDHTPLSLAQADPAMERHFRPPSFQLDSVYGAGPAADRFLYERDGCRFALSGGEARDLPRGPNGLPLIADARNAGNPVLAELHVAFLKFHNAVVEHLWESGVPENRLFERASKLVRWHYQWMVLHDLFARLVEPGLIERELVHGHSHVRQSRQAYLPFEFFATAFPMCEVLSRPGVSQKIDWHCYFRLPDAPHHRPDSARLIQPPLACGTATAIAQLKRGAMLGLPGGQSAARKLQRRGAFDELTPNEITTGADGEVARKLGFHHQTPLWYYLLKEAQVKAQGRRLGPVGSRIVVTVALGLLDADEQSFLHQPHWRPSLPAETPGTFRMSDLLRFIGAA